MTTPTRNKKVKWNFNLVVLLSGQSGEETNNNCSNEEFFPYFQKISHIPYANSQRHDHYSVPVAVVSDENCVA